MIAVAGSSAKLVAGLSAILVCGNVATLARTAELDRSRPGKKLAGLAKEVQ
jgi:hypothetical protein